LRSSFLCGNIPDSRGSQLLGTYSLCSALACLYSLHLRLWTSSNLDASIRCSCDCRIHPISAPPPALRPPFRWRCRLQSASATQLHVNPVTLSFSDVHIPALNPAHRLPPRPSLGAWGYLAQGGQPQPGISLCAQFPGRLPPEGR